MNNDMESRMVLVRADDWEVLYVNGKNVSEGHHVYLTEVINILGGRVIYLNEEQEDTLAENGYFPETYDEFEEEY